MKLSDIFDALAYGELSGLSVVEDGAISPDKYSMVINSINMGLNALATRFSLRKETLVLKTRPDLRVYNLDHAYTASSGSANAYILDTVSEPFDHRLLEVLSVKDKDDNEVLGDRLIKVATDILRTAESEDAEYTVKYSAMLKPVPNNSQNPNFDASLIEVELPYAYLNALLYFIASRHYSPVLTGLDGTRTSLDMSYYQRYEAACLLLVNQGIDVEEDIEPELFSERGFI